MIKKTKNLTNSMIKIKLKHPSPIPFNQLKINYSILKIKLPQLKNKSNNSNNFQTNNKISKTTNNHNSTNSKLIKSRKINKIIVKIIINPISTILSIEL